jgi:hypothetical protein
LYAKKGAVGTELRGMEIGHVDARDLRQMTKTLGTGFVPHLLQGIDEGGQQLLSIPE